MPLREKGEEAVKGVIAVLVALAGGFLGNASGLWESKFVFDPVSGVVETAASYTRLELSYNLGEWAFTSRTTLNLDGITAQQFRAVGPLGLFNVDSTLTFCPVPGGVGSLREISSEVNAQSHLYDLGRVYLVEWVEVKEIELSDPTDKWWVQVSHDGEEWWSISPVIEGESLPGRLAVEALVRFIKVELISGGYIDSSRVEVSLSSNIWRTRARLVVAGVTLDSTFTLSTAGHGYSLRVGPPSDAPWKGEVTAYFDLSGPEWTLRFTRLVGRAAFSLPCCVGSVESNWSFSKELGWERLFVSVRDIPLGCCYMFLDASTDIRVARKDVSVSLKLDLPGSPCISLYADLDSSKESLGIDGISVYGFKISCQLGDVRLESLSYLGGRRIKGDYWEMISVQIPLSICCGEAEFKAISYFGGGGGLFGLGEVDVGLKFKLENVSFSTQIVVDRAGWSRWVVSLSLAW